MKKRAFKMKGYSYPGTAPTTKKAGPEVKQVDVDDMVDPFSIDEQAYENAQNDYDTSNPTKAQIAASKRKILKERKK